MERSITISRLETIATAIPSCRYIADIGTDHAYLPIELIRRKQVDKAIAIDVVAGPLQFAQDHIGRAGLKDLIECRLGNGLAPLAPGEVDGVIIAGMGGRLISDIITTHPEVVTKLQFMMLQPMRGGDVLRRTLQEIGWKISGEWLVEDHGKIYEIIRAIPGTERPYTFTELVVGPKLLAENHPLLEFRFEQAIRERRSILEGLAQSRTATPAEEEKRSILLREKEELEASLCKYRSKQSLKK